MKLLIWWKILSPKNSWNQRNQFDIFFKKLVKLIYLSLQIIFYSNHETKLYYGWLRTRQKFYYFSQKMYLLLGGTYVKDFFSFSILLFWHWWILPTDYLRQFLWPFSIKSLISVGEPQNDLAVSFHGASSPNEHSTNFDVADNRFRPHC